MTLHRSKDGTITERRIVRRESNSAQCSSRPRQLWIVDGLVCTSQSEATAMRDLGRDCRTRV
jgi:hypothetical protein